MATQSYVLSGKTYTVPAGTSLDDLNDFINGAPKDSVTDSMNAAAHGAGISNPGVSRPAVDPVIQASKAYSATLDPGERYIYNLPPEQQAAASQRLAAGGSMAIPVAVAGMGMASPVGSIAQFGLKKGLQTAALNALRPVLGGALGSEVGQRVGAPVGRLLGNEEAGKQVGSTVGGLAGAFTLGNPEKLSEVPFLGRFLTTDDEYADIQAARSLGRQAAMERAVANDPDAQQRALGAFMNKGYQNVGDVDPYAPRTDQPFEPTIYSSPEEYDQIQRRMANLTRQASSAGTYHAAQGSATKATTLQQRIQNAYSPTR